MTKRLLIILLALAAACCAHADSIDLRTAARADTHTLTLSQIADLAGPEAESLADLVIAEHPTDLPVAEGDWRRVEIALVRSEIEAEADAGTRINWGRLSLQGQSCLVRWKPAAKADASPTDNTRNTSKSSAKSNEPKPLPPTEGTIRGLVEATVQSILAVRATKLRIAYDEHDYDFLAQPIQGRIIDVRPAGRGERMPLTVTIYEGDQIIDKETIRIDAEVEREVVILNKPVNRAERLEASMLAVRTQWVRAQIRPAPLADALGSAARGRMDAGAIVEVGDIEAPIAVRRGERLTLHCVTGTVVLRTQGRAMDTARDGELVEVQIIGSERRVNARMSGPGVAVLRPMVTTIAAPQPTAAPQTDPESLQ